jgi:hypothetical protein
MGQVLQLFNNDKGAKYVRSPKAIALADRLNLGRAIETQQNLVDVYSDLVHSSVDPRDSFVARQFAKEVQLDLDKLVAEYAGKYGVLIL